MTGRFKRPSQLFWKLFLGYGGLMTVALVASILLILNQIDSRLDQNLTENLEAVALTIVPLVEETLDAENATSIGSLCQSIGQGLEGRIRVTVVDGEGQVLGDSHADYRTMEPHGSRPEIRQAMQEGWGTSTRWSQTVSRRLRYVAQRVGTATDPQGVVRVAMEATFVGAQADDIRRIAWTIAIVALTAAVAFTLAISRLWTRPLRQISAFAGRMSRGDFSTQPQIPGSDEVAQLAQSLNEMRGRLEAQLSTIDHQRQTLQELLNQLNEGVIVAGPDGRVVLANPAAMRLLHPTQRHWPSSNAWVGKPVEQCVPQHDLQVLLLPNTMMDTRIETTSDDGREPQLQSLDRTDGVRVDLPSAMGTKVILARVSDADLPGWVSSKTEPSGGRAPRRGRILALTDITEIARVLQMKTDFVANASHEFRTPLTAIRGAIETLVAMNENEVNETARQFLDMADRHSARLEALVDDLLELSRLESPTAQTNPRTTTGSTISEDLLKRWSDRAERKSLGLRSLVDDSVGTIRVDTELLQLALDNLIDNAIKFTPAGGHIHVRFTMSAARLVIEVTDTGIGIPLEDQGRVFERFYQVAPSRTEAGPEVEEVRGTGLGLAIVRYAVTVMGGSVTLKSTPGRGTTISVHIPQEA